MSRRPTCSASPRWSVPPLLAVAGRHHPGPAGGPTARPRGGRAVTFARRARRSAAVLAVAVVLAGCGSTGTTATTRPRSTGPRTTYVAVGGSDAIGGGTDDPLLDAWTQQFFRRSLPLDTVFVNAAVPGATVAAGPHRPGTPRPHLAGHRGHRVARLGRPPRRQPRRRPTARSCCSSSPRCAHGGTTTVLVGNVPPLAQLPGYPACRGGATRVGRGLRCPVGAPRLRRPRRPTSAAYDQAIAADAARSGAILVDLQHAVSRIARARGGAAFLDPSGADLSTAGSTLVAQAFGAALPVGRTGHTGLKHDHATGPPPRRCSTRRNPAASARAPTASAPTSTQGNHRLTE